MIFRSATRSFEAEDHRTSRGPNGIPLAASKRGVERGWLLQGENGYYMVLYRDHKNDINFRSGTIPEKSDNGLDLACCRMVCMLQNWEGKSKCPAIASCKDMDIGQSFWTGGY